MDKNELEASKNIHRLSIDHHFAKRQFNKLIKRYEKNKILCGKYFLGVWIDVFIPRGIEKIDKNKVFEFKNISFSFLADDQKNMNNIEIQVLNDLNSLNNTEKNDIIQNYNNLFNTKNQTNLNYLFIIPNLINMFYKKEYRFLFIPTTVDFNVDVGLVHQCLLLIDLREGVILFYEPYLSFVKYEHDYSFPIKDFFQIYKNCLPEHFILDDKVKYKNYSEYFEINRHDGIQSIILNKNNTKKQEFEGLYNTLLQKIKNDIPNLFDKIKFVQERNNNPVNSTDNTIKILDVIYYFEKWKLESKFSEIYNEILYIYGLYNSKSCVSLTLIEMNYLFHIISSNQDISNESLKSFIKDFHKKFKTVEYPSKIVLQELYSFINS